MGEKALWPAVALAGIIVVAVTVLLSLGVESASIIAVFATVVLGLVSLMLFGKIQRIEHNTNGMNEAKDATIRDFIHFMKTHNSVPVDVAPVVMTLQPKDE